MIHKNKGQVKGPTGSYHTHRRVKCGAVVTVPEVTNSNKNVTCPSCIQLIVKDLEFEIKTLTGGKL